MTAASPVITAFDAVWPNPTAGATGLTFSLARDARVQVRVHDVAERLVRSIDMGQRRWCSECQSPSLHLAARVSGTVLRHDRCLSGPCQPTCTQLPLG